MRIINKLFVLLVVVKLSKSAPDPCSFDVDESSCDQTEYEAYKNCVHNESKNEVRKKRQAPCPLNNLETLISIKENCQRANFDCRISCGDDEICQSSCPVCPLNVDELIATSANNTGEDHRTIIVESDDNVDKFQTINAAGNITTVIRLTNIINTTLADVPQVDSGNIDLPTNNGEFGLGANADGPCCYVVHPKTCTSTSNGPRCHHRREKICGKQCTAKVIHAQVRKRCSKSSGCHNKITYVPQPKRPKCVHTRKWPYVSCGNSYSSTCDGCYDHYGMGFEENDDDGKDDKDCQGCFDDAFDYGPLYRRGPVLRPYFYHAPPCYIMGTCYPYPLDCGFGCFDHELIDPGWGHHHQKPQVAYDDEIDDEYDETEINLENSNATNANQTEESADDWAIEVHKCKVVSDNGTIEIRNCTSEDVDENPYAGSPSEIPYHSEDDDYDGDEDDYARPLRFSHQRVVYYSVPVIEGYNYDEEENEVHSRYKHKRHTSQRQRRQRQRQSSIVYDDEENN